jgi:hypothetical protein
LSKKTARSDESSYAKYGFFVPDMPKTVTEEEHP